MDANLTWSVLLYILTLQVTCETFLSKQDLALLVPEQNPKCFTRDLKDFTCFWEASKGKSYDFFYKVVNEKKCDLTLQESEEGKVLYICSFLPSDVYIFIKTDMKLVDKDTNTTIFTCSLYMENQLLLDPPSNVYLNHTGEPGQILVRWQVPSGDAYDFQYELGLFSNASQDTKIKVKTSVLEYLLTLVPGQIYTVQLRLKPDGMHQGYWSDWSSPVTAIVPQSADDIELQCHTPDLQHVQCLWKDGPYKDLKLHHRQKNRGTWGSWKICNTSECVFGGEEQTMFHVYVTAHFKIFSQTFYMDKFMMNNSIKTEAPGGLKEVHKGERLCVKWTCPLQQISQHLVYQVRYQLQGESEWKFFTVETPTTYTCLDVQASGQYAIQIKAMPSGSLYSGQWSAWSKPLMCSKTTLFNTGLLCIAGASLVLIILGIVTISYFPRYVSKVKEFLWPPVPNLNNMLDSFLKDINGQHWEPNISSKLCDDDIPASVVEIMSEKEVQVMSKPTNCHYTSCQNFLAGDTNGEHVAHVLMMSREYVTLKTNDAPSCLSGNDYVFALNGQLGELYCVPSQCSSLFPASTNSILNQSYVQAEIKDIHMSSGHYTNLENAVTGQSREQASE